MRSEDGKSKAFNDGPGPLGDLPSEIASEFVDWAPPWVKASSAQGACPASGGSPLNEIERRYLKAVISSPGQTSSAYPPLVGISARKALQIRKHLVDLGFIRQHVVNAVGRGRPSIVLEPTARAQGALGGASEAGRKQ